MKENKVYMFLLILTASMLFAFSKGPAYNGLLEQIKAGLANYIDKYAPEKIYLLTDKPYYTSGEMIWFKLYLAEAILHLPTTRSRVAYVELIGPNNNVLSTKRLFVENGGAAGDFQLNKNSEEGDYLIRVYTNYMLNENDPGIFQKRIKVWHQTAQKKSQIAEIPSPVIVQSQQTERPQIQFFPEGGDLIEGVSTTIAIQSSLSSGKPVSINGVIKNGPGEVVSYFRTYKFGLGSIPFKPKKGERYEAAIIQDGTEQVYPLPLIQPEGYVLNVVDKQDKLEIKIKASKSKSLKDCVLIGHIRGQLFCSLEIPESKLGFVTEVPIEDIPGGVAHLTLFAKNGEPQCERLIYIDHADGTIGVDVSSDKISYKTREKVDLNFKTEEALTEHCFANFSVSVTDLSSVTHKPQAENIKTWFLLNSDLKGRIPNPNYFFEKPGDNHRKKELDLVLLTQGWRHFVWNEILNNEFENDTFPAEDGLYIKGKISKSGRSKDPVKAHVFLSSTKQGIFMEERTSSEDGRFSFGPYLFHDSLEMVIQARIPKREKSKKSKKKSEPGILEGSKKVKITLESENRYVPGIKRIPSILLEMEDENIVKAKNYLTTSQEIKQVEASFDLQFVELDEVVIKARSKKRDVYDEIAGKWSSNPDIRLVMDSLPHGRFANSVSDFLKTIAGMRVYGQFPDQKFLMRGFPLLYFINGVPMHEDITLSLDAREVLFIDVFKWNNPMGLNSMGINHGSAIAIYTRNGARVPGKMKRYAGISTFEIEGFYKSREFYSPNYFENDQEHIKPDIRTTVYWQPEVLTDDNGEAKLSFYTGDNIGSYLVKVEGITLDGRMIYETHTFEVQ